MAITPDGKTALSASRDETVRVWDVQTGTCVRMLKGNTSQVNAVAITPDGKTALSASDDKTLRVWDVQTGTCIRTLEGHTREVNAVAITPDGKNAFSASSDDTVRVWDLKTGRVIAVYALESAGNSVAVISNNRFLVGTQRGQLHFLTLHNWP